MIDVRAPQIRSPWTQLMSSEPVRAAADPQAPPPPPADVVALSTAAAAPPAPWAPAGKRIVLGLIAGLSLLGGTACTQGHRGLNIVETHMSPAATFDKAHDMITSARTSIKVEMYEIQNQEIDGHRGAREAPGFQVQQQLVHDLVKMHDKGRDVRVILDQSERESGVNNSAMKDYLESRGIEVKVYPTDTINLNHVKLLVVDGQEVLVGGVNWGSLMPKHHDAAVSIKGPAARDAQTIFDADWDFASGKPVSAPHPAGTPDVRFATTAPCEEGGGSSDIRNELIRAIPKTRSRLYVQMFTLNEPDVMDQLAHLKADGRDVRVMLDKTQPVNQKAFEFLRDNHVPVRWFKTVTRAEAKREPDQHGLQGGWLHAKWGVQDAAMVSIGSANWTRQGLDACGPRDDGSTPSAAHDRNHEVTVFIRQPKVAVQFEKKFLQEWDAATER